MHSQNQTLNCILQQLLSIHETDTSSYIQPFNMILNSYCIQPHTIPTPNAANVAIQKCIQMQCNGGLTASHCECIRMQRRLRMQRMYIKCNAMHTHAHDMQQESALHDSLTGPSRQVGGLKKGEEVKQAVLLGGIHGQVASCRNEDLLGGSRLAGAICGDLRCGLHPVIAALHGVDLYQRQT